MRLCFVMAIFLTCAGCESPAQQSTPMQQSGYEVVFKTENTRVYKFSVGLRSCLMVESIGVAMPSVVLDCI